MDKSVRKWQTDTESAEVYVVQDHIADIITEETMTLKVMASVEATVSAVVTASEVAMVNVAVTEAVTDIKYNRSRATCSLK